MGEQESTTGDGGLFAPGWGRYDRPGQIVALGHFYPRAHVNPAKDLLRERHAPYSAASPDELRVVGRNLGWTRLLNALNEGRQWPIKRLVELLDPMLLPDIAVAVVPTHMAYQAFWPVRTLAKQLAENGRIDATACLVRHTSVKRITFGGPSTKALHRTTIRVEEPHRVAGRQVLLLDDVAKSGSSLLACRDLLLEAGAERVQALALGRVIVDKAS